MALISGQLLEWFKEPAELYFSAVKSFGFKLLLLFAKSLDLEDDFFKAL